MKRNFYMNLKHFRIFMILIFSVMISTAVVAQWTILDGSVLPNEFDPAFVTSSGSFVADENMIVDDPEIVGNSLLRMDVPGLAPVPGQTAFYWRQNLPEGTEALTLVVRVKGNTERDMAFDLDMDFNASRTRISLINEGNVATRRNGVGDHATVEASFTEWQTYRFTMTATETKLYVNEGTDPVQILTPAAAGTNRYFRFGDGDNGRTFGADIDWLIWDTSGAYAPGEGAAIPAQLIPVESNWTVYDAGLMPNAFDPVFITSSGAFNETENQIIADPEINGNNLLWMDVSGNPQSQFLWRMNFASHEIAVDDLTIVIRAKGNPERDMALDLDMHYNDIRSRVSVINGTNLARIRNGSGTDVTLDVDVTQWNIYRFVMSAQETNLYVNENPIPVMTFTPAAAVSGNRHFRIGDGDGTLSVGTEIDWIVWDVTGAFAPGQGSTIPDELSLNPINLDNAKLINLMVDGETIEGFDPAVTNYEIERLSGLALPIVSATPEIGVAKASITQVTELPGNAVVVVKSASGSSTQTYNIAFTEVSSSNDATLSSITLNGEVLEGFNSLVNNYNVELPYGSTLADLPVVAATPNVEAAAVAITQATALPGDATINVTAVDGTTVISYTLSFSAAAPSADATLASIIVNGDLAAGFHKDSLYYTEVLPHDTESVNVSATATHEGATLVINNPSANVYNIVVTAQDGTSTRTYYVMVVIAVEVVSEWNIYDASVLPAQFQPAFAESNGTAVSTTLVNDEENAGNSFLELVTAQVGQTGMWRMDFGGQLPSEAVTIVFRVKAANDEARRIVELDVHNGGFRERVYLNREANAVRLNQAIGGGDAGEIPMAEGQSVSHWHIYRLAKNGNDVKLFIDEVPVPFAMGTTTTSTSDDYFRIGGGNSSHNIGATIDWIIWDISGAYAPGEGTAIPSSLNTETGPPPTDKDASLVDLTLDGASIEGFSALTYEYHVVLPHGSSTGDIPVVAATANIEAAYLNITQAGDLPGVATVIVTSVDSSAVNTYTISFRSATNIATLSNLMTDGVTVEGFDPAVTTYDIELPEGTRLIPVVTAITSDANASRVITQANDLPGVANVVVTAEDGTTVVTYIVNFSVKTNVDDLYANLISLYPNPVDQILSVELSEAMVGSQIRISNLTGQLIMQKTINSVNSNIDVSELSSGIYLISIFKNDVVVSKRITKR